MIGEELFYLPTSVMFQSVIMYNYFSPSFHGVLLLSVLLSRSMFNVYVKLLGELIK